MSINWPTLGSRRGGGGIWTLTALRSASLGTRPASSALLRRGACDFLSTILHLFFLPFPQKTGFLPTIFHQSLCALQDAAIGHNTAEPTQRNAAG